MRKLLGCILVITFLVSISLLTQYASKHVPEVDVIHDNTIVRLHGQDGRFFCTGTVIAQNKIATAAHCVSFEMGPLGTMIDKDLYIEVRGRDGLPTYIQAHIQALDSKMDTALLMGDFSHFSIRAIEEDGAEIDAIMLNPDSKLVTCGYSLGGKLQCARIGGMGRYLTFYSATKGWMYYGCSGGPVIDLRTGKVLAVNHGMIEDKLLFNPLVNFLAELLPRG